MGILLRIEKTTVRGIEMRLTAEEIDLVVRSLTRAATRYESEARYAKSGRGANNVKAATERARKVRKLRDRIAQSIGLELKDTN
jgi:hypothetical protein